MKVRRTHEEINPYPWHAPELLQKSTFLATKIQAEFTGAHQTNYGISISTKINANDKTHENPDKSVWSMAHIANLYRNCSKSPHFWRQKYRWNYVN